MKKYLLLPLVLLSSCSTLSERLDLNIQDLKYFKDYRTNLCFAGNLSYDTSHRTTTNVPCTGQVETLLVNKIVSVEKEKKNDTK